MVQDPVLDIVHGSATDIVAVRRVVALMNATAGAFSQTLAEDVRQALAASFTDHGVSAAIAFIDGEKLREAAEGALAQAKRGEIDAIVVGGGDGSVCTFFGVHSGLAMTSIALLGDE